MSKDRWDVFTWDNVFHLIGGFIAGATPWTVCAVLYRNRGIDDDFAVWILGLGGVGLALAIGIGRELKQHWRKHPIWNKHRITEAGMWLVGSLPSILLPILIQVRPG